MGKSKRAKRERNEEVQQDEDVYKRQREMYTKLFVYVGPDHKHAAQKPEALTF